MRRLLVGPRALGVVAIFLVIAAVSVAEFVLVREGSQDSQAAEAGAIGQFAISRVQEALDELREELSSTQASIEIMLSDYVDPPGARVRFPDLRSFVRAQAGVTQALQALQEHNPFLFAAAVGSRVGADDVPTLQHWLESDLLHVGAGSLNLSAQPMDGVRVPPAAADEYWPVLFHEDLVSRAPAAAMLDLLSLPARAGLVNYTLQTGQPAASFPTPLVNADLADSLPRQVVYQALSYCNTSSVPTTPCVPAAHDRDRALGLLLSVFDHEVFLRAVLAQSHQASRVGVRIRAANGVTTASLNWAAVSGSDSAVSLASQVSEFQGRFWTVEVLVRKENELSSTVDTLSWVVLFGGTGLAACLMVMFGHHLASVRDYTTRLLDQHRAHAALRAKARREALMHFLRATSHDMRTPLQALELALEEQEAMFPAVSQHTSHVLARQGLAMLGLIVNNVLDVNRIERDDMRLAKDVCDIGAEVDGVAALAGPAFAGTDVELVLCPATATGSSPRWVRCDRARILRCVLNLVSNAQKFTREGTVTLAHELRAGSTGSALPSRKPGWVTRVWRAAEAGDGPRPDAERATFVVTVTDTGRGMTATEAEHAILPFISTREDNAQGAGLGLHVVLASVLAHRGWLSISSRLGEGTEVAMGFGVQPSQAPSSDPMRFRSGHSALPPLPPGSATDRSVLVVDDQVSIVKLLQRQIQRLLGSSTHVRTAVDGQQAVEAVLAGATGAVPDGADPVGLVFMDVNMPGVDGLEATRRIRSTPGITQPRIVVLTGNATTDDRDAAMRAGADAFEAKPCGLEAIKAHLVDAGFTLAATAPAARPQIQVPGPRTQSSHGFVV